MDSKAWRATVHGLAKSQTLSRVSQSVTKSNSGLFQKKSFSALTTNRGYFSSIFLYLSQICIFLSVINMYQKIMLLLFGLHVHRLD